MKKITLITWLDIDIVSSLIRNLISISSLWLIPGLLLAIPSHMQDSPYRTRLDIECTQYGSGELIIEVQLRARIDRLYVGVPEAEIEVFQHSDTTIQLLQKGNTDQDGFLEIRLENLGNLEASLEGLYLLSASYDGDANYESSESEFAFRKSRLDMQTSDAGDSMKQVIVTVYEPDGEFTPIPDAEVFLVVPRMFSDLPIADDYTNEDGKVEFIFPNDLPGGPAGEVVIKAKIEDIDNYAAMISELETNWGIPTRSIHSSRERALWTPNAPLWMVITFAVLMTLVWGHLLIIIFKLFLIKKESTVAQS